MVSVLSTVGKDQVSLWKDAFRLKYLLPNIAGLVIMIVGIVLLITGSICASTQETQESAALLDHSEEKPPMKESCKAQLIAGVVMMLAGILTMSAVGIVLMSHHMRATVELVGADAILNAL